MRPAIKIALDWAIRAFGREHVYDNRIRALRVAEEAIELAQACGVDGKQLLELVKIVYNRPVGQMTWEIGGVLMTINVLCASNNLDPEDVFTEELLKVLQVPADFYTKRNQEKLSLGLN
jgi:phosphoribosyl-ATP pyrophosphohydrolase